MRVSNTLVHFSWNEWPATATPRSFFIQWSRALILSRKGVEVVVSAIIADAPQRRINCGDDVLHGYAGVLRFVGHLRRWVVSRQQIDGCYRWMLSPRITRLGASCAKHLHTNLFRILPYHYPATKTSAAVLLFLGVYEVV